MTTPVDTAAARELAEAATPGPWEHVVKGSPYMFHDQVVATCGCCGHVAGDIAGWDAKFIAAARDLVPAMADEIDSLRRQLSVEKSNHVAAANRLTEHLGDSPSQAVRSDHCAFGNSSYPRCCCPVRLDLNEGADR